LLKVLSGAMELSDEETQLIEKADRLMTTPLSVLDPAEVVPKTKTKFLPIDGIFSLDAQNLAALGYISWLTLPEFEEYLDRSRLGTFETDDKMSVVHALTGEQSPCRNLRKLYSARRRAWIATEKDAEGRTVPSAVLNFMCARVDGREGPWVANATQLLVYGKDNRARLMLGAGGVTLLRWGGLPLHIVEAVRVPYAGTRSTTLERYRENRPVAQKG